jgi:mono/diheme cytochrome c family protein
LLPVKHTTLPYELTFPYNIVRGLGLWQLLYVDGKTFKPDPEQSAEINRGAYLVEGPGHCGECHTSRNFIGGVVPSEAFAGARNPEGKGKTPNITPSSDGIGDWSADDIAYLLETGNTPDFDVVGGAMAPVQENMAKLKPEDRAAIATYLTPCRERRKRTARMRTRRRTTIAAILVAVPLTEARNSLTARSGDRRHVPMRKRSKGRMYRRSLPGTLALLLCFGLAAPASAAELYGLVVGIDDCIGTENDLDGAVKDAKDGRTRSTRRAPKRSRASSMATRAKTTLLRHGKDCWRSRTPATRSSSPTPGTEDRSPHHRNPVPHGIELRVN